MGEKCERCDKPVATEADWEATPGGEGEHLCWGFCSPSCVAVDWRARALAAETERDAMRAAILDLQHADAMASAHSEDCPGKAHVVGEDCGADGDGGWTCCEGLSREGCLAAERDRCNCGLVAWRAQMRAAGDLARGFRAVEVDRG